MRKINSAFVLFTLAMTQAFAAGASTATLQLVAHVPVQCAINLDGALIESDRVTVSVHRICNTRHTIALTIPANTLSDMRVDYAGTQVLTGAGTANLNQPEFYYDSIDQIVIKSEISDADQLREVVRNMNLTISPL